MRVRDAMTQGIVGVRDTASLAEAVETMLRAGISALCVFDERKALVGILSEGDLTGSRGGGPKVYRTPEMVDCMTAALDKAGVDYQEEVYPGTRHGWAVADTPVYQREGAEHHWERLLALFRATLQAG